MIRFITLCIVLIIYLVFSTPFFFVYKLISRKNPEKGDYLALRSVQRAFKILLAIAGVKTTVIGEENIPDEAVLFIGNHRSQFDILLTYSRCKRLTGYVAKKELEKFPFLNARMRSLHCLFLDRENPREGLKTIIEAINHIKKGISVCIFPEGTRHMGDEGTLMEFKEGSFKVATKTGCAIIPMSILNSAAMFEHQFPKIRPTHVVIEYGKPIYPKDLDKEDQKHLGVYCSKVIEETLQKNMATYHI
ncbi:MAG: lysophospholipid acyltransferase family protein [Eubacteriales bacterium]